MDNWDSNICYIKLVCFIQKKANKYLDKYILAGIWLAAYH